MKIFLCRHGQTTGDIEDRFGGDYDDHLTNLGKGEAIELSKKLSDEKIEKIFSSPKIRAIETTKILSPDLHCDYEIVADLRERNQNSFLSGMVRSEAKEKYPELVEQLKDYRNTITGAESYEDFSQRVHLALFAIAQKDFNTVAVVTHGGPIKAILRQIKYSPDYKIEDCAFAKLEVEGNKITVVSLVGIEAKT